MIRFPQVLAALLGFAAPLLAFPHYLDTLQSDPMLKAGFPTHCGTCHVNPNGGGKRNRFGEFFATQGDEITPLLRARDGVKFSYPAMRIGGELTIHFSDPKNRQVILEHPEKRYIVVDLTARQIKSGGR